jgi:peroxiredoxin
MRKGMKGVCTMTPFIPFLVVTSLYEVFTERMEYDDTFHTFFLIVTSLYDVLIERMEYDDTFHTAVPSINASVSEVTMRKGMKGVIVLRSLNKYFIH